MENMNDAPEKGYCASAVTVLSPGQCECAHGPERAHFTYAGGKFADNIYAPENVNPAQK